MPAARGVPHTGFDFLTDDFFVEAGDFARAAGDFARAAGDWLFAGAGDLARFARAGDLVAHGLHPAGVTGSSGVFKKDRICPMLL